MSLRAAGRIGPNAIIQTAAALGAHIGEPKARELVRAATGRDPETAPTGMVTEREVIRLMHALRADLDPALFEVVLRDAGVRTADYLIAHRIPRAARALMRLLPPPLGLRVLLAGILRHTWTFAGTACVSLERGTPTRLVMRACPMCRGLAAPTPICHFYAATLGRLVARLVSPHATVVEVTCEAMGAPACEFALRLD